MSYADTQETNHRRTSSRFEEYRSRDYSDDYGKSRHERTRDSNGYDRGDFSRGSDRRIYSDRAAPGPTRYTGDVRRGGAPSGTPKPSKILGVFGLSLRTKENHLYDVMSPYGHIEDIQIVYDNLTGRSRGFAFVYFRDVEDAQAARSACSPGLELHDRVVRVDFSLTAAPHQPTPGVYMGKDKRRMFPDRGRKFGFSDRRGPRTTSTYRRSRSRSRSPRRRSGDSPYRRSRLVSSSRSRSPPPIYTSGHRRHGRNSPESRVVDQEGSTRYRERSKDDWSNKSTSPR